jgi:hypothetical protein
MNPKLLLGLALVLGGGLLGCFDDVHADEIITNSPALANSEQDYESLLRLVEQKKFQAAQELYYQYHRKNGGFALEQRNAVFLLAAKSLVMINRASGINQPDATGVELNTAALYFMNTLACSYNYVSVLDGITYADCVSTTPEVIPYLIIALQAAEAGDSRFIDQKSKIILQILHHLTRREIGYVNGDDHYFERHHEAVIDWWQDWWRQNKNRHPVFDVALEKNLRDEVLKIDEKIGKTKPTPNFRWDSSTRFELEHAGNFYTGNEWNGGPKNSVFRYEYGHVPGNFAMGGGYFPERGADVLYIHGEFLTKWLPEKEEPIYGTTISGKKFPMQEIFSKTVEGTGIAIKVQITTTNAALINILREKLNE